MYTKIGQTALLLLLCLSINAYAGEPQQSDTTYTLGEIVVTEPKTKSVETIGTMHQITARDIEMRGAKTLDRSRHVILLLNGIPFNSTYDGQFDPATISTENIAKIKVSYGNHSVLYGQGGLGGVINIITKKGTQKLSGGASATIAERGDYSLRADISGGSEKMDVFVSGHRQDSDGFRMSSDFDATNFENGGIRENSDAERNNIYANLGMTANKALRFAVAAGANKGEYAVPTQTNKKPSTYDRIEDYTGQFGQLSLGYDPKGPFSLKGWVYINKTKDDTATYNYKNGSQIGNLDGETKIYGTTVQTAFTTDPYGKLSISLNGECDTYTGNGYKTNKKGKKLNIDTDREIKLYAAAAEYEITLFDRMGLVAGYSHHWQHKDEGDNDDQGSWLMGVTYDVFQTTQLRASYAHKIRFATIKNLYGKNGNPDLTTEQSDNFELGITQVLPYGIMADLAVFKNQVKNYIARDKGAYKNNDTYQFKGVDLLLSKPFSNAGLSLGYSWMAAEDKSQGALFEDLDYRPKHKFTLQGNYAFDFGLTAYASVMKVMDQVHHDDSGKPYDIEDYLLVDVTLEQRVFKNNCFVYIGADNLFDEDYEESDGYPQAGRTAYAGVRFRF